MSNPVMPNLPGFGAITETMELVRKMWGGMGGGGSGTPGLGIPGMVMPSLSVEDINKQIADLKAVESWLTLNMNMLRGTIQALEVQSATISTLKTMSENFSAAVRPPVDALGKPSSGFGFPFGGASVTQPDGPSEEQAAPPEPIVPPDNSAAATASTDDAAPAAQTGFSAPIANPAAWWNMLQEQFKHAVSTAMTPELGAKAGASLAPGSGARPTGKTSAAKTGTAPARKSAAKSAVKSAVKRTVKKAPRQR